jgi:hypothetical protein
MTPALLQSVAKAMEHPWVSLECKVQPDCQGLSSAIIFGRPQPSCHEHQVRAVQAAVERGDYALDFIGDNDTESDLNSDASQLLTQPFGVGIATAESEQLGTDGYDCRPQFSPDPSARR